jgi:redox-sensitive bicupin YhaK (pirin superfamily)
MRALWLQLISGTLTLNGEVAEAGDAAALSAEKELRCHTDSGAHFLLFDVA